MIRINLLPLRAARKREAVQRHLVLFGVGLAAILMLGFANYQRGASELSQLERSNKALTEEIENLKKVIGEVDEYKQQEALLAQKLGVIQTLKARKTGPVHMLDQLALRIPEKLWLVSIQEADGQVTMKGVSINNEVIATFMSSLEESDYFTEVYLVSIQREDQEDLSLKAFTVKSKLVVPGSVAGVEG